MLLVKFGGVALMAYMGLVPRTWTNLAIIVPVYLIRTAIINSAYPIQKSILMDYVPKVRHRAAHLTSCHCMNTYCLPFTHVPDRMIFAHHESSTHHMLLYTSLRSQSTAVF